jgi:hypothetical protein
MVSALAIDKSSFVEEVLRSRKICRPIQGQPLFGIYRTVCTEVQQQLFVVIAREVNRTNPPPTSRQSLGPGATEPHLQKTS